jgi:hypothetical protein
MIFRTLSDRTTRGDVRCGHPSPWHSTLTFVLADILEGECEACIFPLDDADLSERAFSDHAEEAEMVEID